MYFYSSGTKFSMIVGPLQDWQRRMQRACDDFRKGDLETDVPPPKPNTMLKRLTSDHEGMYGLLGDAIVQFMKLKPQPYGNLEYVDV